MPTSWPLQGLGLLTVCWLGSYRAHYRRPQMQWLTLICSSLGNPRNWFFSHSHGPASHWGQPGGKGMRSRRHLLMARSFQKSSRDGQYCCRILKKIPSALCCYCSVAQLCLTLCVPMDCSTPGFPVHHQFLEFTQIHVHCDGKAVKLSHPLSFPSLPASNLNFQLQNFYLFL